MNNTDNNAIDVLVKEICKSINYYINKASFNKGLTGTVVEKINNNIYKVAINKNNYYVKSRFELEVNDTVKIIELNNDINELYVIY